MYEVFGLGNQFSVCCNLPFVIGEVQHCTLLL